MSTNVQAPRTYSLDQLFTLISGEEPVVESSQSSEHSQTYEPTPPPSPPPAQTVSPPPLNSAEDIEAAYNWLRRERERLETYTKAQFQHIRSEHQSALADVYVNEQRLAMREQELSRQEDMLAHQMRILERRNAELQKREQTLNSQMEAFLKAQQELAEIRETSDSVRYETEAQKALLQSLLTETSALQRSKESAGKDLQALELAMAEHRQARAREQAQMAERMAKLEERAAVMERTELLAQRRMAEVEEWETRVREELEDQERELAHQRREVEMLAEQLRKEQKEQGQQPIRRLGVTPPPLPPLPREWRKS